MTPGCGVWSTDLRDRMSTEGNRIQRDLGRLEQWAQVNYRKFNKSNCKVLHLGNLHYQYNLGDVKIEHSYAENSLKVPVDGKLGMSQ